MTNEQKQAALNTWHETIEEMMTWFYAEMSRLASAFNAGQLSITPYEAGISQVSATRLRVLAEADAAYAQQALAWTQR